MHLVYIFTYLLAIPVSMCSSHTISLENATSYTELSAFSTKEAVFSLFLTLLTLTMSLIVDRQHVSIVRRRVIWFMNTRSPLIKNALQEIKGSLKRIRRKTEPLTPQTPEQEPRPMGKMDPAKGFGLLQAPMRPLLETNA